MPWPFPEGVFSGPRLRQLSECRIALRLGRKLTWDPESEAFIGDGEANAMLSREPREGYEIRA
jgi:GFO/IDH/MocA oxidoreductase family protein